MKLYTPHEVYANHNFKAAAGRHPEPAYFASSQRILRPKARSRCVLAPFAATPYRIIQRIGAATVIAPYSGDDPRSSFPEKRLGPPPA
jgi:hypothetical protein